VPVDQVRLTGRSAMGVTLLRLNEDERVTSVFPVLEQEQEQEQESEDG
jgi:DNA gyrase subunit A